MFERFTDRARKVMALANQEAQRFNHECIGTEHILLGLAKEGSGVGANVLKNLDVDLRKVRLDVVKLVKSGPDMVTIGKLPQTPQAKLVIEEAIAWARSRNENHLGTEHLLVGLVKVPCTIASEVLKSLGVSIEGIVPELEKLLDRPEKSPPAPALASLSGPALAHAVAEARGWELEKDSIGSHYRWDGVWMENELDYRPDLNWAQAGVLLDEMQGGVSVDDEGVWTATARNAEGHGGAGPAAICRAWLAWRGTKKGQSNG